MVSDPAVSFLGEAQPSLSTSICATVCLTVHLPVCVSLTDFCVRNVSDEPSTGMDPKTRRKMWDYLITLRSGQLSSEPRGIILTTHSMVSQPSLRASSLLLLLLPTYSVL